MAPRAFSKAVLLSAALTAMACGEEGGELPTGPATAPTSMATHTEIQALASTDKVLILGSSVNGGAQSREAQAVQALSPSTQIDVVTAAQWRALTTQQFMTYRAIIIGDAACESGTAAFQAAVDTRDSWGPIIDGSVVLLSSNPSSNATPHLVENAIQFALDSVQQRTGMYIALGCAYQNAETSTAVQLLEPFGVFKVQGVQGCATAGHLFEMNTGIMSRDLSDGELATNNCVTRSVFTQYPDRNFSFVALARNEGGAPLPGEQIYSDFMVEPETETLYSGTPYVLVRGASNLSAGCGLSDYVPSGEECDLGDGWNGQAAVQGQSPLETCSYSCHYNWCGDGVMDAAFGEECDDGNQNGRALNAMGTLGTCSSACKLLSTPPPPVSRPPTALCQDTTVVAEYTCGVDAGIDRGSYDADNDLLGCTQSPAGPYNIGNTPVTLTCRDRANNSATCTGVVTVVDAIAPVVTLIGPANHPQECNRNAVYADPGATATDLCSGAVPVASRTGTVPMSQPGTYTLIYNATDSAGNHGSATRTVPVTDTRPPTLSLLGAATMAAECGAAFNDPGASASDLCAGNLPVTRTGSVDTTVLASYSLRYSVRDASNNAAAEKTRSVTVVDTLQPTVTVTGPMSQTVECGSSYTDPGATATDVCAGNLSSAIVTTGTVNTAAPGSYTVSYAVADPSGYTASGGRAVTVRDTQAPVITPHPGASALQCNGAPYVDPGATANDACLGDLTPAVTSTSTLDQTRSGTYAVTYQVADASGNVGTATRTLTVGPCTACTNIRLGDYNLFLEGNYTGGHDVVGKVAAGGDISMTDFAVGSGLPASDISNTLVAGGNLTLSRGAIWGDTSYGGTLTADQSVTQSRGTRSQGTPINFAARFAELRSQSAQLASMAATGTTRRESWGGISMNGTRSTVNVFDISASAFTGAVYWQINAPAGSLVVVNIRGAAARFTSFGIQFSGGIDQHGVLFNFVDTTSITASGFGFWGTVLAPNADVNFSDGSWDGGIYAKSFTGSAEGHINTLNDRDICP